MKLPFRNLARGFTLIELSAALMLLAILISLVYGSVTHAVAVREKLAGAVREFEEVQGLLDRIRYDLEGTYSELRHHTENSRDGHTLFVLEDDSLSGAPADHLQFTSLANQVYFVEGEDHNTFAHSEIGYDLVAEEEGAGLVLTRRQDRYLDTEPAEGGQSFQLARHIRGLAFRVFNPVDKSWSESWDSRDLDGAIPAAVEVTVWYGGTEEDPDSWLPVAVVVPLNNRNYGFVEQSRDVVPKNGATKAAPGEVTE